MARRRRARVEEPIIIEGPEFECAFMKLHEYPSLRMNSAEGGTDLRGARYHGSMFWSVKGFGTIRWVIAGYIVLDWEELLSQGLTKEEIFKGCAKFLNKPPVRKKFEKRITKPLYGMLQPDPVKVTLREKDGVKVLEVLAITNKRKSKWVWGEGPVLPTKVKRRGLL
jgi:hypothetical protein